LNRQRILIAPNSFKECADSVAVAELIKNNLRTLINVELITKPISDGGDGFLSVCKYYFGGEIIKYLISTPYDDSKFECPILVNSDQKSIYIESAEILGFKVVPDKKRNPLLLSSKGLGELLLLLNDEVKNRSLKIEKVYIGIGGTATIDMGLGMMSKLGLELFNLGDKKLTVLPIYFGEASKINFKAIQLTFSLHPVIDVLNPLFGNEGGIRVFGKQKGADDIAIKLVEDYFNHICNLLKHKGLLTSYEELSGAGGGIPAAFQIFFDSRLIHSENFIYEYIKLDSNISNIDFLITGEGSFDKQSVSGKGAWKNIEKLRNRIQKIFLICGEVKEDVITHLPENVHIIQLIDFFNNKTESIKRFNEGIKKACDKIIEEINF
jgi:glycerate kinase